MQTKVLNYRIIIEPEKQGKKTVYNAYCPALKVTDYGDSITEVLASIKDGIELALEILVEEGKKIPVDAPKRFVTTTQVKVPSGAKLSVA